MATPLGQRNSLGVGGNYFHFGPNSVAVANYNGYRIPPQASSAGGDPVLAAHFNGLVLNNNSQFTVGGATFEGPASATVNATAVPEPTTYAVVAGVGLLGFAAWRRRR